VGALLGDAWALPSRILIGASLITLGTSASTLTGRSALFPNVLRDGPSVCVARFRSVPAQLVSSCLTCDANTMRSVQQLPTEYGRSFANVARVNNPRTCIGCSTFRLSLVSRYAREMLSACSVVICRIGWEAGIRTPITWSRATCPTVERPPNGQVETPIILTRRAQRQKAGACAPAW
jgi:hypothetical protein